MENDSVIYVKTNKRGKRGEDTIYFCMNDMTGVLIAISKDMEVIPKKERRSNLEYI